MSETERTKIWQVSLVGIGDVARTFKVAAQSADDFQRTTVIRFRQLLQEKWPDVATDAEHLLLLFAGKELQDKLTNGESATLGDYYVECNSTIIVIFGPEQHSERVPRPARVLPRFQTEKVRKFSCQLALLFLR